MKTAFCFDLDSTLTTTGIFSSIASELGISDEIATLTHATMEGFIAFEPSFRLQCLIVGQLSTDKIRDIIADIPLEESVFSFISKNKNDSFLVTENLDIWMEPIADKCGCKIYSSKGFFDEGIFRLPELLEKSDAIDEIRTMGYEYVVSIGCGANDISMLAAADVRIVFGGIHTPSPTSIAVSDYIIHEGTSLCRMLQAL